MQTFMVVSVSAVTVREGDGAAVRYIANTNAAQSLRAQNNGGGECISLDQFSYLNPNTNAHCVCVYVGTVYCRLAIIKCRENIEKYKTSLIEYGDENIQFRVPESTETERRKQRFSFHVSCLKIQSTIRP